MPLYGINISFQIEADSPEHALEKVNSYSVKEVVNVDVQVYEVKEDGETPQGPSTETAD